MQSAMKYYDDVDSWKTVMFLYNSALKEVGTKLEILNETPQTRPSWESPPEPCPTRLTCRSRFGIRIFELSIQDYLVGG